MNNNEKELEQIKKWHKAADSGIRMFTKSPDGLDDEVIDELILAAETFILQTYEEKEIDFNQIITIEFDIKKSSSFNWIRTQVLDKKNPLVSNDERIAVETAKCVVADLSITNIPDLFFAADKINSSTITISYPLHNLLFENIEGLENKYSSAFKLDIQPIIGLNNIMKNHNLGWFVSTTIGGTISPDAGPAKTINFIKQMPNG